MHTEDLLEFLVNCKQQLEPVCLGVREFQDSTILSQLQNTRCYEREAPPTCLYQRYYDTKPFMQVGVLQCLTCPLSNLNWHGIEFHCSSSYKMFLKVLKQHN